MKPLLTADLHLLKAPFPNHIKLDTESGESSWHTTSEKWIPEEGLYDHLVPKSAKIMKNRDARTHCIVVVIRSDRHVIAVFL
jgi:hypothetical protein